MPVIATEGRSRFDVVWYDNEFEANHRNDAIHSDPDYRALAGYVQPGRNVSFDKEIDGKPAYAVIEP